MKGSKNDKWKNNETTERTKNYQIFVSGCSLLTYPGLRSELNYLVRTILLLQYYLLLSYNNYYLYYHILVYFSNSMIPLYIIAAKM